MEEKKVEKKGFSITSMVLGIVSIVFCCVSYISIPCAILAIIFGVLGKKRGAKGMATTGFVLGIVTLSLCVLFMLSIFSIVMTAFEMAWYWI